jgi:hypothetical protein
LRILSLILCNCPPNNHSDIVTATTVERVLNKLLANLTRGFHRAQSFGDFLI